MQRVLTARINFGKSRANSFTLVELLVVIAIIGILMAITLAATSGVMASAARGRANAEIKGISTALELYKNDNGQYPQVSTMATNNYTTFDSASSTNYTYPAQMLYQALSGQTNYLDTPLVGAKVYMPGIKASQLGNATAAANSTVPSSSYFQDPWGYPYGYSTGTTTPSVNYPYNGIGFFDLWSTAGTTLSSPNSAYTNTAAWICNWHQ